MEGVHESSTLVLLSGGVDSACALHWAIGRTESPEALHVSYGQRAEVLELAAATAIARHYDCRLHHTKVERLGSFGPGEVIGRNLFLVAAAAMIGQTRLRTIVLGLQRGPNYYDCGPQFVHDLEPILEGMYVVPPIVATPFIAWPKSEVIRYAQERGVPLDLTYSCEQGGNPPCGVCMSCRDLRVLTQ